MVTPADPALDKLTARIRSLRAKTIENGCTLAETLLAAAKVAELVDRYDLTLSDIDLHQARCEQRPFESSRGKRIPLEECIGAIAAFCDCRVWREKERSGAKRYVFFGLRSDVEAAHYLADLVDSAIRFELGRYKASAEYRKTRHQDRHLANASFTLGMAVSLADNLLAIKTERNEANRSNGRDLVVLKAATVDAEFEKLDLTLRHLEGRRRTVSPIAYDAGDVAGLTLAVKLTAT